MTGVLKAGALKNAYSDSDKKTQNQLKKEVNDLMKKSGINYQIGLTRLNDILNDRIDNLRLHEGLALSTVLNSFLSDFVNDTLLELGSFELKLRNFNSGVEFDEFLLKREVDGGERLCIYATFPSYPFFPCGNLTEDLEKQRLSKINEARFENIMNGRIHTREYFTLDSYLNFLFYPVSRISKENKILTLDRMLDIFNKKITPHKLHFFSSCKPYQRTFSSMELFRDNDLAYMNSFLPNRILIIKNKRIYETISKDLQVFPDLEAIAMNDALDLLNRGKAFLMSSHTDFVSGDQLHSFCAQSSTDVQALMRNVICGL